MNPIRERINLLPPGQWPIPDGNARPGIVSVRNTTASAVERYNVLQLDVPCVLPDDENKLTYEPPTIFDGIDPITDPTNVNCGFGRFCITTQAIQPNASGLATVQGFIHVKLNADHGKWKWADIGSSKTQLYCHAAGSAFVVWMADEPDADGLYNGVVNLNAGTNNGLVSGILNGSSALYATGLLTPDKPDLGDLATGATDITYTNTLGPVDNGSRAIIAWIHQRFRFELVAATCVPA